MFVAVTVAGCLFGDVAGKGICEVYAGLIGDCRHYPQHIGKFIGKGVGILSGLNDWSP